MAARRADRGYPDRAAWCTLQGMPHRNRVPLERTGAALGWATYLLLLVAVVAAAVAIVLDF